MNNKSRIFIFIGIAVAALLIMQYCSKREITKVTVLPKDTLSIKNDIDSLRATNWNLRKYTDLKIELESMKAQEVISTTDAILLEDRLDMAYAETMQKASMDWKSSDCNSADINLLQSMEKIVKNPKCSVFVSSEIEDMRSYFRALQIPNRVKSFTQSKFNDALYNQLIKDISVNCNRSEISRCSRITSIKSSQVNDLNAFKVFANAYESNYVYYLNNSTNYNAIIYYKRYCPEQNSEISNYSFYLGEIQSKGICP